MLGPCNRSRKVDIWSTTRIVQTQGVCAVTLDSGPAFVFHGEGDALLDLATGNRSKLVRLDSGLPLPTPSSLKRFKIDQVLRQLVGILLRIGAYSDVSNLPLLVEVVDTPRIPRGFLRPKERILLLLVQLSPCDDVEARLRWRTAVRFEPRLNFLLRDPGTDRARGAPNVRLDLVDAAVASYRRLRPFGRRASAAPSTMPRAAVSASPRVGYRPSMCLPFTSQ